MNKKTENIISNFAVQNGFMFVNDVLYGKYNNYDMNITLQENAKIFAVSVGIKKDGQIPTTEAMREIALKHKDVLSGANAARLTVTFTVKPAHGKIENTVARLSQAIQIITYELNSNGYVNCCQGCGSDETGTYMSVTGTVVCLCESCVSVYTEKAAQLKEQEAQKPENVVGGVVGAFIGSVLGAICIILISRLGYVSAISGLVMGVCALKGYEILGGKLSNKGAVISCIIMGIMVLLASIVDWGIIISQAYNINVFNGISLVMPALAEGIIGAGDFIFNIILLYLFTALGAIPTVRNGIKARELKSSVYALPIK